MPNFRVFKARLHKKGQNIIIETYIANLYNEQSRQDNAFMLHAILTSMSVLHVKIKL